MPRGNRTGPMGAGPRTGRGAGYCAGFDMPGFANQGGWTGAGRSFGRGWSGRGGVRGAGRGWRNMYYATGMPGWQRAGFGPGYGAGYVPPMPTREDELDALRAEAEYLQGQLEAVTKRIEEMEEK